VICVGWAGAYTSNRQFWVSAITARGEADWNWVFGSAGSAFYGIIPVTTGAGIALTIMEWAVDAMPVPHSFTPCTLTEAVPVNVLFQVTKAEVSVGCVRVPASAGAKFQERVNPLAGSVAVKVEGELLQVVEGPDGCVATAGGSIRYTLEAPCMLAVHEPLTPVIV
jgi:hypothetical protein